MKNRTEYKNQWMKENRDTKLLTLPKGRKSEIQDAAGSVGESLNDFICKAIDERMERMKAIESSRPWYHTEDAKAAINQLKENHAEKYTPDAK